MGAEFAHVWMAFCALIRMRIDDVAGIVAWTHAKFWHEDATSRALLADVFLDLWGEWRELSAARAATAAPATPGGAE